MCKDMYICTDMYIFKARNEDCKYLFSLYLAVFSKFCSISLGNFFFFQAGFGFTSLSNF